MAIEPYDLPRYCPFDTTRCDKTTDDEKNQKYFCPKCGKVFIVLSWKSIGIPLASPITKSDRQQKVFHSTKIGSSIGNFKLTRFKTGRNRTLVEKDLRNDKR